MNKKIKVLRIISTLDQSFGGPTNTIVDSSLALAKSGFKVDILTFDNKLRLPARVTKTPPPTIKVFHLFPNQLPLRRGVSIYRYDKTARPNISAI